MNGISLLLIWASLGVVYSWRTGIDGQQEYVLQVEPEILQTLSAAGEEIHSEVPADAGNIQRLCIVVLPKGGTPAKHSYAAEERFRQLVIAAGRYASSDTALASDAQPTILWPSRNNPEQTYGITTGWQPDVKGSMQFFVQLDPTVLRTLAIGDELYVPIDPSAGRPSRFIVKSGKENLPHINAPQTQLAYGNSPTSPQSGASNRGRFPGVNVPGAGTTGVNVPGISDTPTPPWAQSPPTQPGNLATDYLRQTRQGSTATDPRTSSLWPSGSGTFSPSSGTMLNPPSNQPVNSYDNYQPGQQPSQYVSPGTQYSDPRSYGTSPATTSNNFDRYRNPNVQPYDVASSTNYPPQNSGQQPVTPQINRNGIQQPFDTRLTGGQTPPAGTNILGAASTLPPGTLPPGSQPPNQEKPWGPLLFVTFALFFSIGGNLYLAYTALEFHSRYRNAIERLRSAARSA
jgi:hypothetical protein